MAASEPTILSYHGQADITVWLQGLNGDANPVLIPYRPAPEHVAVFLEWLGNKSEPPFILGTVRRRADVLQFRAPGRLWFCNIPVLDLCLETSAEADWYD